MFDRYRAKRARNRIHRMLRHSWQDISKRDIKDAIKDYNKILHTYLKFCSNPESALPEKYRLYAEIRELYVSLIDLSKKRLMIPPELSRKKETEGGIRKEEGIRKREGTGEGATAMPAAQAASPAKIVGQGVKKPRKGGRKTRQATKQVKKQATKQATKPATRMIPKKRPLPEKTKNGVSKEKKEEKKEEKKGEKKAAEKEGKKPSPAKQGQKYATLFDEFYAGIDPEKGTFLFDMAKKFRISNDKAEHWAKILENNNMIIIDNPVFGGPLLRIKKEGSKEENNDDGDKGNGK